MSMGNVSLSKVQRWGQWLQIWGLYQTAFPRAERKPFGIIYKMARQGKSDVWVIEDGGRFAGFATTINSAELVLLDYFAVECKLRSKGIGTAALGELMDFYPRQGIFVEIEDTAEPVQDKAIREKRKQFYRAVGMKELNVRAEVFGVNMELLGAGCSLDFDGYRDFYREHYNPWAAEHILPVK